jgi:hypothetical protein
MRRPSTAESILSVALLAGISCLIYLATSGAKQTAISQPTPSPILHATNSKRRPLTTTTVTVAPTSALPYVPLFKSPTTSTTVAVPYYSPPTSSTLSVSQQLDIQEAQNVVTAAQAQVQDDEASYQSDESAAQHSADQCSEDQAIVQTDGAEGIDPTDDEDTSQQVCATAQGGAMQVADDASALERDEGDFSAAEQSLQLAEQG